MAALLTNPSLMGLQRGRNVGEQDNLLTVLSKKAGRGKRR